MKSWKHNIQHRQHTKHSLEHTHTKTHAPGGQQTQTSKEREISHMNKKETKTSEFPNGLNASKKIWNMELMHWNYVVPMLSTRSQTDIHFQTTYLNVSPPQHDWVHLLQCQLSSLWHVIFHKGKPLYVTKKKEYINTDSRLIFQKTWGGKTNLNQFQQIFNDTDLVFHCYRIPRHVNALDGTKGGEGLSDGVFPKLIVYGAHIHPTHDGESTLSLSCNLSNGENKHISIR